MLLIWGLALNLGGLGTDCAARPAGQRGRHRHLPRGHRGEHDAGRLPHGAHRARQGVVCRSAGPAQGGLPGLFGAPVHEFSAGLEALYADLLALEALLIDAATSGPTYYCEYLETIADEDRVDGFKLMAMRVVVEG